EAGANEDSGMVVGAKQTPQGIERECTRNCHCPEKHQGGKHPFGEPERWRAYHKPQQQGLIWLPFQLIRLSDQRNAREREHKIAQGKGVYDPTVLAAARPHQPVGIGAEEPQHSEQLDQARDIAPISSDHGNQAYPDGKGTKAPKRQQQDRSAGATFMGDNAFGGGGINDASLLPPLHLSFETHVASVVDGLTRDHRCIAYGLAQATCKASLAPHLSPAGPHSAVMSMACTGAPSPCDRSRTMLG